MKVTESISKLRLVCARAAIAMAVVIGFGSVDAQAQSPGAADLSITKMAAEDPLPNETNQTYTIIVTNNGPETAMGVIVSDRLPAGSTFQSATTTDNTDTITHDSGIVNILIGTLQPNAQETITIISQVDANGPVSNFAAVRHANGCDYDSTNNSAEVTFTASAGGQGPGANLVISKTDFPDPVAVGSLLTYTVSVLNSGPAEADEVVVTDVLPSGAQFVSASASQGTATQQNGVVIAKFGDVANGNTVELTITIRPQFAGTIVNTAFVRSNTNQSAQLGNNSTSEFTTVTGTPVCTCCAQPQPSVDLSVTKSGPSTVTVDDPLTYTIVVTNNSQSTATGVLVSDTLPAELEFVSVSAVPSGMCVRNNQTITCGFSAIGPGQIRTITIGTIARETGEIANTAVIQGNQTDPNTGNNTSTQNTTIEPADDNTLADLSITKTARETEIGLGQTVTYDIVVTNNGPDAATLVRVLDTYPATATFVSATPSTGTCTRMGNNLVCRLGTLQPTEMASVVLVLQPTTSGDFVNAASVRSNQNDPNLFNNIDTAQAVRVVQTTGCPDLTGMFKMTPIAKCKEKKNGDVVCKLRAWFAVMNIGDVPSQKTTVDFYLSEDQTLDPGDIFLRTYKLKALKPGQVKGIDPKVKLTNVELEGRYLIAVIDPQDIVDECNENNNTAVSDPIVVVF